MILQDLLGLTIRNYFLDAKNPDPSQASNKKAGLGNWGTYVYRVDELARRPSIAFIHATDSTEMTLQKAHAAIRQVEQRQ